MILIECGLGVIFAALVIAHFILWGNLKSFFKKSYPSEWKEYSKPLFYKILGLDKGIINLRFGYFMQFAETHKSLAQDVNIKKRIQWLQWIHGLSAAIGVVILLFLLFGRPY